MDLHAQIQSLQAENAALRQENQLKSDFLSMIVHQLRTPLAATKWTFKMMLDGDLGRVSDSQKSIIRRGMEGTEQMIRMLADISQANHVAEWKMHFNLAPMNIAECIDRAIGEFAAEAKAKDVSLSFSHHAALPYVTADHEKICLVVQNLIENAIKYNRPGGTVEIHAEPFNDRIVVSVTDSGIGIPFDSQKKIFTKFYRAENAKKSDKGTGLGLFVGKEIVEGHHGSLWFESVEGVGTTFFFSLPLA